MSSISDPAKRAEILAACTRTLGQPQKPLRERLTELAQSTSAAERADRYGGGKLLEDFEAEIAALLGKEAAVFMPSGTMAQQIALRLHAEDTGNDRVAIHARSHLIVHENDAVQRLAGLRAVQPGHRDRLYSRADLEALREPVGALLVELPERELGGLLRPWDALLDIVDWAMQNKVRLHLDGARLWEAQPFYGKPLAELAGLFDSAYVSFYKILNGIAGAALAGPAAFIDRARLWQHRYGGRLISLFPEILSAREGLRRYLPRMAAYRDRAVEIAAVFSEFEPLRVVPDPPHTNMMHVYVNGDAAAIDERMLQQAQETGIRIFGALAPAAPGVQFFEVTVAEGAFDVSNEELRRLMAAILQA